MLYHAIYLFITALVLAFLEVQIEGKHGWASKLPTWKPGEKWYARAYRKIMGGKELTGYHIGVFGIVLLFLHYPFFSGGLNWNATGELWVISTFFIFSAVWDYLWIIINPHYGVIKARPQKDVWWHNTWWGPFPADYYFALLLSVGVLYPIWSQAVLREWGMMLGIFALGTIITLIITELIRGDIER
ncbi:MAG: hypothetical protein U1C18_00460 [Patescibacteria group bacterium]|nr:hypothetical protein [Patescibacteria group bacterium]